MAFTVLKPACLGTWLTLTPPILPSSVILPADLDKGNTIFLSVLWTEQEMGKAQSRPTRRIPHLFRALPHVRAYLE